MAHESRRTVRATHLSSFGLNWRLAYHSVAVRSIGRGGIPHSDSFMAYVLVGHRLRYTVWEHSIHESQVAAGCHRHENHLYDREEATDPVLDTTGTSLSSVACMWLPNCVATNDATYDAVNNVDPTGMSACGNITTAPGKFVHCTGSYWVETYFAFDLLRGTRVGTAFSALWMNTWAYNPSTSRLVSGLSGESSYAAMEVRNTPNYSLGSALIHASSNVRGGEAQFETAALGIIMATTSSGQVTTPTIVQSLRGFTQSIAWLAAAGLRNVNAAIEAVATAASGIISALTAALVPGDPAPDAVVAKALESGLDRMGLASVYSAIAKANAVTEVISSYREQVGSGHATTATDKAFTSGCTSAPGVLVM